jgi:hypothetical protein
MPVLVNLGRPEVGEFAKLALEFLDRALREVAYELVDYVVILNEPLTRREARRVLPAVVERFGRYPGTLATIRSFLENPETSVRAFLSHVTGEPWVALVCLPTNWDGFRRLVHEYMHAILHQRGVGEHIAMLAKEFLEDTELYEIVEGVAEWSLWYGGEALTLFSDFITKLLVSINEVTAEYATLNYFTLLNTSPTFPPHRFTYVIDAYPTPPGTRPLISELALDLMELAESIKLLDLLVYPYIRRVGNRDIEERYRRGRLLFIAGCVPRGRLPPGVTEEEISGRLDEFVTWAEFRRYLGYLHEEVLRGSLRRFPKDVFLEDPRRYARLFKGIPLEVLRRATRERGLHVMDETRVPGTYEQAVRDPDSVPVLPESPGSPGRPRTLRELVEARLPRVLTLGN